MIWHWIDTDGNPKTKGVFIIWDGYAVYEQLFIEVWWTKIGQSEPLAWAEMPKAPKR